MDNTDAIPASRPPRLDDDLVVAVVADQDAALANGAAPDGVAVVIGAGASITVRLGHLVVEDGVATKRRTRRFPRAMRPADRLTRLVVEAASGTVSLDALTWCRSLGVVVVGLDRDGEPAWSTSPDGPRDARLIRALAVAGLRDDDPLGMTITRRLLRVKLAGQQQIAAGPLAAPQIADTIGGLLDSLDHARSVNQARQMEASAAALYFDAWTRQPAAAPTFARRDASRVPDTWNSYDGRRSLFGAGHSNRRASHPTNAILNYLYSLARVEANIALQRLGLDPALGVLHADMARRDSLACDLLEAARPAVDRYTLQLLARRSFRRVDFLEGLEGEVRLGISLRTELAETLPRWATEIAPHAEQLRRDLADAVQDGPANKQAIPSGAPLTNPGGRRKTATPVAPNAVAGHRAAMDAIRPTQPPQRRTTWRCPDCGGEVRNPRHVRCPACQASDPNQRPEVRSKRAKAIAARKQAQKAWEDGGGLGTFDPEAWPEILAGLQHVKLADIVAATGLSKSFASRVRAGEYRPHPSTWAALTRLGEAAR
ncbi:CRISPR-associated endonuclease Cas1 [Acidimicrobiaceae bacterium USS-CC1]|uniref:CRISPR-associated endonuclease Cas1 n=1 Tax=Acidiferrimicrobium australe TaxID=2664430 RepID=A0ABW9QNF9_9ACTN|nr:CRISPR-associated endonuclease Cas1 [Acidiferrimicrobium australe]